MQDRRQESTSTLEGEGVSWPRDGEPRFKVGSVTGVPINEATIRSSSRYGLTNGHAGTVWYVYDRANCHRIAAEVRRAGFGAGRIGGRVNESAKVRAYRIAYQMENEAKLYSEDYARRRSTSESGRASE